MSPDLTSLSIEEEGTRPDQLSISLSDPFKVFGHALQEGMEVEVELGTVEDHSIVFRGRFYKIEGEFPQDGVPKLRLLAYDRSMRMGLRKRNRAWSEKNLSAIVTEIAGDYFNRLTVRPKGDPTFTRNGVRQLEQTDLEFLRELATRNACEQFVVADDMGDEFYFLSQYEIMNTDPEITLYHGRTGVPNRLISFQASSDVSNIQLPRVFSGVDDESGEPTETATRTVEEVASTEDVFRDENLAEFRASEPEKAARLANLITGAAATQQELLDELGEEEREPTMGFASQEDLQVRVENQFSTSIHGMRGNGATVGNHRLRAQASVRIADVGGRFSDIWYVSQVRHSVSGLGYQTEFQCQR